MRTTEMVHLPEMTGVGGGLTGDDGHAAYGINGRRVVSAKDGHVQTGRRRVHKSFFIEVFIVIVAPRIRFEVAQYR
jgi:hypothetical protein